MHCNVLFVDQIDLISTTRKCHQKRLQNIFDSLCNMFLKYPKYLDYVK